jgi:tetratricopeptide (TPR) repeat protein
MELMAGDQLVPSGSTRYARGIAQFRANLDALLARYQAAGIPVFVGTLVSNERDQAPFVTTFAPGVDSVAWRRRYDDGLAALARGDTAAAEASLGAAVRLDSTAAAGQYALGRLLDARGDTARARRAYRAAKETDALRFRAPEAMNAVIREVAARRGAIVVESQRALEAASPGGVPGHSLILEHLHPNVDGYFAIADAFYETLRQRGAFGSWRAPVDAARARPIVPVTAVDSVAAVLRTDRLTSGWPFRARGVHALQLVDTLQPRTPPERLAQALVRGTMSWAEATDRLRAQYEQAGDVDRALHVADVLAGEYHYTAKPYLDAARVALAHRRDDDALRYARAAEARQPSPASAELIGLQLLRRGEQADALPFLQRAAERAPADASVRGALAGARMLPYLAAERARAPRDTAVLFKLALAYTMTQQPDRARAVLDTLYALAPQHPGASALRRQLTP